MHLSPVSKLVSVIVFAASMIVAVNVAAQKKLVFTNSDTINNQKDIVDYLKPFFIKDTIKYHQRK